MKRALNLVAGAALLGGVFLAPSRVSSAADIRVCENANMRPPCIDLRHGVNDLGDWRISNSISSFSIGSGAWLMCTETDFRGRCETFSGSRSNLQGTPFQDRISSLRPVRAGGGGTWGGWGGETEWDRIGIAVYTDKGYRGRSWVFSDDIRDLSRMGLSNRISSVRIFGGRWRICRSPNFGGCLEISGDVSNLRDIGFNDQVSSIQELGPGGSGSGGGRVSITVYRDKDYSGRSWSFDKDVRNLGSMGMGNQISSVKVSGGRWRLCRTSSFDGCIEIGEDVQDLREFGINDQINSIQLVRSGGGWGGSGGGPRDEAILYEQSGFRGRSVTVTGEASNLRDRGFNDRAMSIRIRGTWQLCSDANYRGQCVSIRGDQDDLARLGLPRNLSSLRKER
ncbi:MAG: hypothetical protein IPN03_18115 [Holophagales bacterium]|nr:hypothetical protein [Holophagales bacterium]MBK9375579.1 hypothetical protein [Holophagales bacterium]